MLLVCTMLFCHLFLQMLFVSMLCLGLLTHSLFNSAPKSCELDPIASKLVIECLDSILSSHTDLFTSSLAS